MTDPFQNISQATIQGWFARVSSSEQWQKDMDDLWECTASDGIECKNCDHFDEECQASLAEECPQVIAEFNLDRKHFN